MNPDPRIFFIISVADSEPLDASPLQGFSLALCRHSWLISALGDMPSDIAEFSMEDRDARLARRMAGDAPVWWTPLMPSAIAHMRFDASVPFGVLLVTPDDDAGQFAEWKSKCTAPPLVVAAAGGDVEYKDFTPERIRQHCLHVCSVVGTKWEPEMRTSTEELLAHWSVIQCRDIGYKIGGHNAFTPNVMALGAAGFHEIFDGRFKPEETGIAPFVSEIVRTSNSVFEERARVGDRDAFRINPLTPDTMLFAPSIYSDLRNPRLQMGAGDELTAREVTNAVRELNSQRGYRFEGTVTRMEEAGIKISADGLEVNPVFRIRQQELRLCTDAIGMLATSEISAVIRLPNAVNRTAGQVRQFASQRRGADTRDRKRSKAFHRMQQSLRRSVPVEIIDLVRKSTSGIRIVADAPLEWLDIDGIPLGIRFNTARIPTTPGNLLIQQLVPAPRIRLDPKAFEEILIISALERTDPIYPLFESAFAVYHEVFHGKVKIRNVEVGSRQELIEAFNNFEGVFAIFDGHGSHSPNEPAYLWLKDEKIDIWGLRGELRRMPPIILLSACDTHAADRNHATTANGFLSLGATTVLATFFPLFAAEATVFAARLIHRVIEFIPGFIKAFDHAVTWSEVVGGMLRMTLLTDYLKRLEQRGLINKETYMRIHNKGNVWINSNAANPFERIQTELVAAGVPEAQAKSQFKMAIATSSAISYVQLGRPEILIFDTRNRIMNQITNWDLIEDGRTNDPAA